MATKMGKAIPELSSKELMNNCHGEPCKGHFAYIALEWVRTYGVVSAEHMPFDDNIHPVHGRVEGHPRYKINEWRPLRDNEKEIQSVLLTQSVIVSLHCANDFLSYKGGAVNAFMMLKHSKQFDRDGGFQHSVLLVGFGFFLFPNGDRINFWHVKNSYGVGFGDDGYFYLIRNSSLPYKQHVSLYPAIPIVFGPDQNYDIYNEGVLAQNMSLDQLAEIETDINLDIIILFYDQGYDGSQTVVKAFDRVSRFCMHERDSIFAKVDVAGDWNQVKKYGMTQRGDANFVVKIYRHLPVRSNRSLKTTKSTFTLEPGGREFFEIFNEMAENFFEACGGMMQG